MSSNIRQHNTSLIHPEELLQKLGFTDHESAVYLDLVRNGPRPVAILAKRAGMTRTNGYDVVKQLEIKGLCFSSGARYGKKIHAHDPQVLRDLILEQQQSLQQMESQVAAFEGLVKKQKTTPFSNHEVVYLEGKENIKKIFNMMTVPDVSHIYGVGSELELEPYVGRETLVAFHERRKRNKIPLSILRAGPHRLPGIAFHDDETYLREVRIRPKGKVRLKSQIYLFHNTIIFLNLFDKPFATVIHNEPMFIMLVSWFEFIWAASKKSVSHKK